MVRTLGLKRTICLKLVNSWSKAYMCKMQIIVPEIFVQFCVSQFLQYPTHFWTTSTENELIHKIKWADGQWLWLCTWGCHVGVNDHHWCYLDLIHAKLCSISSLFFHLGKIRKENGIWKMINSLLIPFLPLQRHSSGYALLLPGQTINRNPEKMTKMHMPYNSAPALFSILNISVSDQLLVPGGINYHYHMQY